MSDQDELPDKPRAKRDSIVISPAAAERIDRYIEQIGQQKPINLSRKAFLSWYIENGPENLSNKQVNAAINRFYDTKTHLRQLLRDVTAAEEKGENGEFEIVFKPKKLENKKDIAQDEQPESATPLE